MAKLDRTTISEIRSLAARGYPTSVIAHMLDLTEAEVVRVIRPD